MAIQADEWTRIKATVPLVLAHLLEVIHLLAEVFLTFSGAIADVLVAECEVAVPLKVWWPVVGFPQKFMISTCLSIAG